MDDISVAMFTVADQDAAIAFYTGKLGFEVRADVRFGPNGEYRWVEVAPPGSHARLALNEPMGGTPGGGGIGVETGGGAGTTDTQRIQANEYLIINLDAQSRNTDITFNALGAGETAQWYAFDATGNYVTEGTFTNTGAGQIQANTPFQYIVFSAANSALRSAR